MPAPLAVPVITGVLSLIAQIATARSRERYETALAEQRAGVLHDLIDAAYHKRFDGIRSGFETILRQYSDQAEHYMRQQERYSKEELRCDDPIRRVELRSRVREVDRELQIIRIDAQLLYAQMLYAMNKIGMPSLDFAGNFVAPLALQGVNAGENP